MLLLCYNIFKTRIKGSDLNHICFRGDSGDQSGALNGTNGGEFSDTEPETEPEDDQPSGIVSPQVRYMTIIVDKITPINWII